MSVPSCSSCNVSCQFGQRILRGGLSAATAATDPFGVTIRDSASSLVQLPPEPMLNPR